ncbi:hypothetical protein EJ08DRAFT_670998 [Tothia fuscella]|uniref:Swi5-dependent recombination DNA repair protein 1 n=1 Tax=Tothia fuscella TaxID=1048955 RepID=A0A9P4NNZ1_9PEZI|nr:hypothetical protein EJ08DRAFT_670998 [Tothia fuscella]
MDTETPPTAKRRRLNNALHKPFKSPLRGPLRPNANPHVASPLSVTPVKAVYSAAESSENISPGPFPVNTPLKHQVISTPSKPVTSESQDPETLLAIQTTNKDIRRIESAMIRHRQEIDTLQQALTIVTSSKSHELDELTTKWRQASRLAAEEVFAGARDKVNRMGGVGAWREREKEKANFGQQWEQEPQKNEDRDSDDEEGENGQREGDVHGKDERVQEGDWEYDKRVEEEMEEEKDVVADDDSFTMDMMLKTMNIDLDLIGYDKRGQRWVG